MEKILKPYTIIPSDLYVKRSADRQLREIISDMGRPGYVLVSRQMGKTNLLLNAKRELGNLKDKFIYVDLSNTYDNELDCFQNIIDLAIDTNPDLFQEAGLKIKENRKNSNIPPHKQHTNELRELLKVVEGKLIIILDEIDALTKTQYSDKIFAQIRSVYFSRVNYPELERLTYILSGVVEPTEIIKDPKISPFNIGEKIFLNDFSKEEFLNFIEKAKLNNLPLEIIERIFYWTNGNPRMTWDLCSEIENQKDAIIKIEDIDTIVQNQYFTSYDKPPIDNIREMVIANKSIRDALIEIDYNKGEEVADNIKSKLYLAGIINYEAKNIKIKNRIIKNALNRNWLDSVNEQEQGLLKIAKDLLDAHKYTEAINVYERFMANNAFPDKESEKLAYFNLGVALYQTSSFEKCIEFLSKSNFEIREFPKIVFRIKTMIGLCYYHLNIYDKSIEYFKFVIENSSRDELYTNALLNYGAACLNSNNENLKLSAIDVFNKLTVDEEYDRNIISENEIDEVKAIANYNLGLFYVDKDESYLYFKKALETKKIQLKPIFYLNLFKVSSDNNERLNIIESLVSCIIENKLLTVDEDLEKPLKFSNSNLEEIVLLSFTTNFDCFEKLVKYTLENISPQYTYTEYLYILAFASADRKKIEVTIEILRYSCKKNSINIATTKDRHEYNTYKLLAYLVRSDNEEDYQKKYLEAIENNKLGSIDYFDFDIVSNYIHESLKRNEFKKVGKYLSLFYSYRTEVSEDLLINYLVLENLELNLHGLTNNHLMAIDVAKKIVNEIENKTYKNSQFNLLGETGLETIKKNAETYLKLKKQGVTIAQPIVSEKKYRRNDKVKVEYLDGSIKEGKHKSFEVDILNNNCKII